MPVSVRNLKTTVTTFNDPPTKINLEWAPMSDKNGGDIQVVPDAVLEHPSFLRAVGLGIFEIVDDDAAIRESVASQAAMYQNKQAKETDALTDLIDRSQEGRDIVISEDQMQQHISRVSKGQESNIG